MKLEREKEQSGYSYFDADSGNAVGYVASENPGPWNSNLYVYTVRKDRFRLVVVFPTLEGAETALKEALVGHR